MNDKQPVDPLTRTIGWIVAGCYLYAAFKLSEWFESLELPTIFEGIGILVLGLGGWAVLVILSVHFDLFGDRKE